MLNPYIERRKEIDILAEMVNVAKGGARRTEIVYGANLSGTLWKKYKKMALRFNLLILGEDGKYWPTQKGEALLENYLGKYITLSKKEKKLKNELETMKEDFEKKHLTKKPVELQEMCTPD